MTKAEEAKALADNKDIIVSIAKKYRSYGVDMEDLVQEGSIGFLKGIRNWSPEGGAPLRMYASQWAHKYVRVALGCNDIKVSELTRCEESMDASDSFDRTLHDVLPSSTFDDPEEAADRNERIQNVRDAMRSLSARDASIFEESLRGASNEAIAEEVGLSRERVRQIKVGAVDFVTRRISRAS